MLRDHPPAVGVAGPYTRGERLETVVRHHARLTPGTVAVEQGDQVLTYAQLADRADRLAGGLAGAGVRAGDVVPLLVPRSPELVVAVLGVLRAGAAYVAMDPGWPPERIAGVVRRCGTTPGIVGTAAVTALESIGAPAPPESVDGSRPACVFFTSGSTGTPKGALSPHRGPIRILVSNPVLPLDASSVVLQAAPLPWDGMSLELWAALLNGGRCVLLERDRNVLDAAGLAAARRRGVNTLWLTSSLLNVLVDEAPEVFTGLRLLMTGGERVSPAHLRRLLERQPGLCLVNGYGPVENTIFTTTHPVTAADVGPGAPEVPIGTPVPHTGVLLLADDGTPLPPGAPGVGELAVSGDGLALGYLGDAASTVSRFVTLAGARHYRTGDVVELDAAGRLHFRGRRDRQVKVRGVRVELGEVEAVLERCPPVTACRALAVRERDGDPLTLVAAYTTADGQPADAALREHAAAALVPAMVPTRLRHVERFPLGVTGKVDAAALEAELTSSSIEVLPSGHDELTEAFAMLVGRPGLAPEDDLFQLGLTSLDAVRAAAWLSNRLGTTVAMTDLYRLRSLGAVRAELGERAGEEPVSYVETDAPAPLSHAQQRFWLAEQTGPGLVDNLVVTAHHLSGPVQPAALRDALADVVERQTTLRDRYVWHDDGPVVTAGAAPVPLVRTVTLPPEDLPGDLRGELRGDLREAVETAVADWWEQPFDLEEEAPLRLGLAEVADGVVLLLQVHHIAFDGWSEQVFLDDLAAAYEARIAGSPPPAPLPVRYADHSRWERARVDTWRRAEEPFWRRTLESAAPPAFPASATAPEGPRREIATIVPAAVVADLRAATDTLGAPVVTALAAATARAVGGSFGRPDVCVGTVTPGRLHPRTQDLVGYFVNPVVLALSDVDAAPADLLTRAATAVTAALGHARTPFDELVRVLSPPRDRHPWFQTFAVLQHPSSALGWSGGVRVERLRIRPPRTSIELMVEACPRPDGAWELVTLWRGDGAAVDAAAEDIVDRIHRSLDDFGSVLTGSRGKE